MAKQAKSKQEEIKEEVKEEKKPRGRQKKSEEEIQPQEISDTVDKVIVDQLKEINSKEIEFITDDSETVKKITTTINETKNDTEQFIAGVDPITDSKELPITILKVKDDIVEVVDTTINTKTDSTEIVEVKLSNMAQKYKSYIEYLKITPEQFIAKYPKHKFIEAVKEILEWQTKTGEQ